METEILTTWTPAVGLGRCLEVSAPLSHGLIHEVRKMVTERGSFACKILNKAVIATINVEEHYPLTEVLAAEYAKHDLPAVAALVLNGKQLHRIEDQFVLIYPWIKGEPFYYPGLSKNEVITVAAMLAHIHQLDLAPFRLNRLECKTLQPSLVVNSSRFVNPKLLTLCRQAKEELGRGPLCLSHRDLDPKNVLWSERGPFIIDWEFAGYIHPMEELIGLALEWSGFAQCEWDEVLFSAFIHAYQEAGGKIEPKQAENGLYAFMGNYINWLVCNEKRQSQGSVEQQHRATSEIEATLKKLAHLEVWSAQHKMNALLDRLL